MDEARVQQIVEKISSEFMTVGGGKAPKGNPIAAALENSPPQFALGVDVGEVVRAVLMNAGVLSRTVKMADVPVQNSSPN